jgi:DNA-binding response OmpR family regulator
MLLGPESPKADGLEVLKRGRADSGLKTIPAVMLVSSREGQDLVSAHDSRANVCMYHQAGKVPLFRRRRQRTRALLERCRPPATRATRATRDRGPEALTLVEV